MKFPRGAKIFVGQFDPLPYVGVFLCLLIFFLFFQSMILPAGVVVELSGVTNPQAVAPAAWRVVLDRQGNYYFENRLWEVRDLVSHLRDRISRREKAPDLMLEMDKEVTQQWMNMALSSFQEAGFSRIILVQHAAQPWNKSTGKRALSPPIGQTP
jgi:biopolymer transport protein ExbD